MQDQDAAHAEHAEEVVALGDGNEPRSTIHVLKVDWDVDDDDDDAPDLPTTLMATVPAGREDDIADLLSDLYGFCIRQLSYDIVARA